MLVKIPAAAVQGIDAIVVTVEVLVDFGANFTIVGLPDTSVRESADRVRSAIRQSGYEFPRQAITVNLSPGDVRKEGAAYDLPIAVGMLAASSKLTIKETGDFMIMGEMSLDGSLLPIRGVLPMAIKARELGYRGMILPAANATEAATVNRLEIYGANNLRDVVEFLAGHEKIEPTIVNTREEFAKASTSVDEDFSDVCGQENVKRAFEVACAGGHNILLVGPPGSGKSMMAKRLPGIMPPLTLREALETTKIHSVAGSLRGGSTLMAVRPFRSPHHTISPVALVGGGTNPKPGEISLAHNGILFLDEFPEFNRSVLEVLRQPLEDRTISISRSKYSVEYPAGFMLVASMNPCPCGYYNHPTKNCTCPPGAVAKYLNRISGPLLDRIDIQVEIMPVPFAELQKGVKGESSEKIRQRVTAARKVQEERFHDEPRVHCNAQMSSRLLRKWVKLDDSCNKMLENVMTKYDMSARAYDRILKVARTIADLEYCLTMEAKEAVNQPVLSHHVREATGYRNLDRSTWGLTIDKPFG